MRKLFLGIAAAALAVPPLSAPAFAQKDDGYEQEGAEDRDYDERAEEIEERADEAAEAAEEQAEPDEDALPEAAAPADEDEGYRGETWQGRDGRTYCRRSDGTTGTIIGGGAGALVGRGIDTRGERGTGTIIGAVAGALVGRAIERGASCR